MKKGNLNHSLLILLSIFLITIFCSIGYSAVPQKINFQGYITDSDGNPLDGTTSMLLSIYDVDNGGTALWTETQNVTVNAGIYSVTLGDINPVNLPFDKQYYLGVKVGTDSEMTPRKPLTSSSYSFSTRLAPIEVYDANGQYLGISLGQANTSASNVEQIYIPSLNKRIFINLFRGTVDGYPQSSFIWFETNNCSGQAFGEVDLSYGIYKAGYGEVYYSGQIVKPLDIIIQSRIIDWNGSCETISTTKTVVPAHEIALPFSVPVELPLDFKVNK